MAANGFLFDTTRVLCGSLQAVKKEVDTAVSEAKKSPIPEPEALWQNIYKDPLGSSVKGLDSKTHIKL